MLLDTAGVTTENMVSITISFDALLFKFVNWDEIHPGDLFQYKIYG